MTACLTCFSVYVLGWIGLLITRHIMQRMTWTDEQIEALNQLSYNLINDPLNITKKGKQS